MSGQVSPAAQLPDDAWRDAHMIRAWRTRDFRAIFHRACHFGMSPEGIADVTGLALDRVVGVMRGNVTIDAPRVLEMVAYGLGMPDGARKAAGFQLTGTVPAISAPQSRAPKPRALRSDHPGIRIRQLRDDRGWSREHLAERADVSVPSIVKIESQERMPSLEMLRKIAGALGVSAGDIADPPSLQKTGQNYERLPDYLPDDLLRQPEFVAACRRQDLGAIFAAAVGAGFTVSHLARRCEMKIDQVKAYMRDGRHPTAPVIIRVADGLHISGTVLAIGVRPWEERQAGDDTGETPAPGSSQEILVQAGTPDTASNHLPTSEDARDLWETGYDSDEELMRRRAFLANVAALAALGKVDTPAAIEAIRKELNLSFVQERAGTHVDEWQEIVMDYGESYPTAVPAELIKTLMVDVLGMQAALRQHAGTAQERDLLRMAALLSAFTAQTVTNMGQPLEARRWWRTAKSAANRSGDPYSALWVRGREIVRAMENRPIPAILQLIEEAEAITVPAPPEATLELLAAKAQTLALAGRERPATETLTQLQKQFSKSPNGYSGNILSWGQERLHSTESFSYSRLGDLAKAETATTDGLNLRAANGNTSVRHQAGLQLNLAFALVRSGDVGEGLKHAQAIIDSLPEAHRATQIEDGQMLLGIVPLDDRQRVDVQEYREWINSLKVPARE